MDDARPLARGLGRSREPGANGMSAKGTPSGIAPVRDEAPGRARAKVPRETPWDPFEGTVDRRVDPFVAAPRWTPRRRLMMAGCLAGFPAFILGGLLGQQAVAWLGFAMALGLGLWLSVDLPAAPENGDGAAHDLVRSACRQLGVERGWSVRLVEPSVQVTVRRRSDRSPLALADIAAAIPHYPGRPDRPIGDAQYADLVEAANAPRLTNTAGRGRTVDVEDPAVAPAYRAIHPLLAPGAVAARPTTLDAVIHHDAFGGPVWTGVALRSLDETNPRRAAARGEAAGSSGGTLTLVHGVPLPAGEGLSATLRTRRTDALAPAPSLTLGGRFDGVFRTGVLAGEPGEVARALTPTLRDLLIALHGSDDAEAMLHDGALFVRTITRLPGTITSPEALAARIAFECERVCGRLHAALSPLPDRSSHAPA